MISNPNRKEDSELIRQDSSRISDEEVGYAIKEYDKLTERNDKFRDSDFSFEIDMFLKLRVLGQYNSSFIITLLEEKNRIFIVDQHAADEKRNFERFLAERDFSSQILIKPIVLKLPLIEIQIVKENKHIFENNGFSFQIEEIKEEIHLRKMPCFKSMSFDKDDFLELIYLLRTDNYGLYKREELRPNKVKTAIAMRACHSSVRAGNPLDVRKMRDIVFNLSRLKSPWNCPHGRPTMVKSSPIDEIIKKISIERPKQRFLERLVDSKKL